MKQIPRTPLVLMGYANPLERKGYDAVADACAEAGIDGLITVDLPPEEVAAMNAELQRLNIDNIFLSHQPRAMNALPQLRHKPVGSSTMLHSRASQEQDTSTPMKSSHI